MIYKMSKLVNPSVLLKTKLLRNQNIRCLASLNNSSSKNPSFNVQSIGIKPTLNKILKYESFVHRSFFGEFDPDYLKFPTFVASNEENQLLSEQFKIIRENFPKFSTNLENLKTSGFYNLSHLSEVEKTLLFEAIGSSLIYRSNNDRNDLQKQLITLDNKLSVTNSFLSCYEEKKHFLKTVLPLIVHNSLVLNTIQLSDNHKIRDKCLSDFKNLRIGFAFDEPNESFQTVPYTFWNSIATFDEETKTWNLNGKKSRILKNDYDFYIVSCKIKNNDKTSDFGIASFLIEPKQLNIESDGTDNYGTSYLKISFDNLNLKDEDSRLLFDRNATSILNINGSGHLMTSAISLGIMKQLLNNLVNLAQTKNYSYMNLLKKHLTEVTEMIYIMETILYLTSSHYDTFEMNQLDLYLQQMIVQIVSAEYSEKIMNITRFLCDSKNSELVMSNDISDVLCMLNSFHGSTTANRLLLASYGLRHIGKWKFDHIVKMRLHQIYNFHFIKNHVKRLREKINLRYEGAMDGLNTLNQIRPELKKCSDHLKKVLELESDIGNHILRLYGKECVKYQIDMNRFASIIMSAFQMVSVISRSNHNLKNNMSFSSQELLLCEQICKKQFLNVDKQFKLIKGILEVPEEKRSNFTHQTNMRFDGYFAKPTFDRVI